MDRRGPWSHTLDSLVPVTGEWVVAPVVQMLGNREQTVEVLNPETGAEEQPGEVEDQGGEKAGVIMGYE